MNRIIVISTSCKLSISNNRLLIESKETDKSTLVPIEDIGCVIIENLQSTISIPAINKLIDNNVCISICDRKGMPSGLIYPIEGNSLQGERYRIQLSASQPAKKSIWRQLIEGKLANQSAILKELDKEYLHIQKLSKNVKSDDSTNREALAAKIYWQELFGNDFKRDRNGFPPNSLLNYGYAILRSATTRAIIGAGLLPAIGIHHKSRYNAFPLADDIMEPFRPWVDKIVFDIVSSGCYDLNKESKRNLINVVYADTVVENRRHTIVSAASILCNSIIEVMKGERSKIKLPQFINLT